MCARKITPKYPNLCKLSTLNTSIIFLTIGNLDVARWNALETLPRFQPRPQILGGHFHFGLPQRPALVSSHPPWAPPSSWPWYQTGGSFGMCRLGSKFPNTKRRNFVDTSAPVGYLIPGFLKEQWVENETERDLKATFFSNKPQYGGASWDLFGTPGRCRLRRSRAQPWLASDSPERFWSGEMMTNQRISGYPLFGTNQWYQREWNQDLHGPTNVTINGKPSLWYVY